MNGTTFCDMLLELSKETWERIKFSRNRPGLKIFETTITQNLLFKIHNNYQNLPITLFEANDEKTNGNDLEIYLQTKGGYIFLPTQAKIIYNNNRYKLIDHRNQINDLINYAKSQNGFPLYLLYNYVPNYSPSQKICGIKVKSTDYGCTLISAYYLLSHFAFKRVDRKGKLKWIIPNFDDLHPDQAKPWLILGCCNNASPLEGILDGPVESYKLYSREEIVSDDWSEIDFDKEIKDKEVKDEGETIFSKKFSPKFRIIIDYTG